MTGVPVAGVRDAERAAGVLLERGAGTVIITLGAQGALVRSRHVTAHVPAVEAGAVVETTGAGDVFNGALAVALSEGMEGRAATRFACAAAGISVTRLGTSASMPMRNDVEALIGK